MRLFQSMTLFLPSQLTLEQAENYHLHSRGSDFEFQDFCTSSYEKVILISTSGFETSQYSASKSKDGGL